MGGLNSSPNLGNYFRPILSNTKRGKLNFSSFPIKYGRTQANITF
tara:strand:+ start:5284 stop:5418 length:135 start_codon:yes stop_codon:yes gene_type:complete